ncbi:MAG: thioredoxin-disulfide reductase [Watsoniomyces obsoletus]|nr:MAG: thioredoxin-disulfide reductase [Watsoniomyces obsoletus]
MIPSASASRPFQGIFLVLALLVTRSVVSSPTPDPSIFARADPPQQYWSALGDSCAAGPGAGDVYDKEDSKRCLRSKDSYPMQLSRDQSFGKNPLRFLACAAHNTGAVARHQIPAINPRNNNNNEQQMMTLSTGSADVGLSRVIQECIIRPSGSSSDDGCEASLRAARQKMKSDEFEKDCRRLWQGIFEKLPASSNAMVYQTLYPRFFNLETTWCDEQSMGVNPAHRPKLDRKLRRTMNELVYELNYWIQRHAWKWMKDTPAHQKKLRFVNPNNRFDGHRFCEPGVEDARFNHEKIWFFGLDHTKTVGRSHFSTIDTRKKCEKADSKKKKKNPGKSYSCHLAQFFVGNPKSELKVPDPKGLSKLFHPKTKGHEAIKEEILRATKRTGYPKKQNLRIMPLGASITWGVGSTSKNGYRKDLRDILDRGDNQVKYVGSQKSGDMTNGDNEGYPGLTIREINDRSKRELQSSKPNIVLIHAGTNDILRPEKPDTAHERMGNLVDEVLKASPDAVVLVAELVDTAEEKSKDALRAFNARVVEEIMKRRQKGKRVMTVPMHVHEWGLTGDKIHPNDEGYQVMAKSWASALEEVQELGWIQQAGQMKDRVTRTV